MKRYNVTVGYTVPHFVSLEVEADSEEEAQRLALDELDAGAECWDAGPGPTKVFNCEEL